MDTYEKKCFERYTCPGLLKVQESILPNKYRNV